jgi:predicted RNase H-like HicB family nuclease
MKYAVVIHEAPEGGFWAEAPALPGCYTQGESIAELMENAREAISGVLEVLREQGGLNKRATASGKNGPTCGFRHS